MSRGTDEPRWDQPELSVGQLAARGGVSVSALHFYERRQLITSRRTSGNQRRYSRNEREAIATAASLSDEGYNGSAITRIMEMQRQIDDLS